MKVKEIIADFCESNELEFREDYSGRGMYGRTCIGIVCDDTLGTLMQLVDAIRDELDISLYDVLGSPKMDSMGLSSILYFPYANLED